MIGGNNMKVIVVTEEQYKEYLDLQDKATPKKPYCIEEYNDIFEINMHLYKCQNCDSYIGFGDDYCQDCGQKLDWSDEK